jgi:hypothetical protein
MTERRTQQQGGCRDAREGDPDHDATVAELFSAAMAILQEYLEYRQEKDGFRNN